MGEDSGRRSSFGVKIFLIQEGGRRGRGGQFWTASV
jgi:hypothetical protein